MILEWIWPRKAPWATSTTLVLHFEDLVLERRITSVHVTTTNGVGDHSSGKHFLCRRQYINDRFLQESTETTERALCAATLG